MAGDLERYRLFGRVKRRWDKYGIVFISLRVGTIDGFL
jgi:hypothetical protein